jgi:hypothetical protein
MTYRRRTGARRPPKKPQDAASGALFLRPFMLKLFDREDLCVDFLNACYHFWRLSGPLHLWFFVSLPRLLVQKHFQLLVQKELVFY